MCGRFGQFTPPEALASTFGIIEIPTIPSRYNLAPGQNTALIRVTNQRPERTMALARWGLVPAWIQNFDQLPRLINARMETAAVKPAFRQAAARGRALIPADGFYEWSATGGRRPRFFRLAGGAVMALAALWSTWTPPAGPPVTSCAILTTVANSLVGAIHDRMPVIIEANLFEAWLDPEFHDFPALVNQLGPYSAEKMESWPVSTYVNDPCHEGPRCIERSTPESSVKGARTGRLFSDDPSPPTE